MTTSGARALAAVARHHGFALDASGVASLAGADLPDDLFHLLFAARRCGFDVVPLEGDWEHLPEVSRPNVIVMRGDDEQPRFCVLHEIDADSALVDECDGAGAARLDRDAFVARWTGDAIQIEPARLDDARARLRDARDPILKLKRVLGLPPSPARGRAFLPAAALALALAATAATRASGPWGTLVVAALAACLVLSLWSALLPTACRSCSRTAALVGGLPVAWLGVALYAALLGVPLPATAMALALGAAVGAHLALLTLLWRGRIACAPCLATAACAIVAASPFIFSAAPAWRLAATPVGYALTLFIAGVARRRAHETLDAGSRALALQVADEPRTIAPGRAHVVVYKRADCPQCALFDAALRPALEEELGESITVEERDAAGASTVTPLVVACGAVTRVALLGLPSEDAYERLRAAVERALTSDAPGLDIEVALDDAS
jgi:hypothetical protein